VVFSPQKKHQNHTPNGCLLFGTLLGGFCCSVFNPPGQKPFWFGLPKKKNPNPFFWVFFLGPLWGGLFFPPTNLPTPRPWVVNQKNKKNKNRPWFYMRCLGVSPQQTRQICFSFFFFSGEKTPFFGGCVGGRGGGFFAPPPHPRPPQNFFSLFLERALLFRFFFFRAVGVPFNPPQTTN